MSVIIPAYNCAETLVDTVESVIQQGEVPFECLIVDDGSKDSTLSAARGLAAKYASVKVVSKANGGPSSARNEGLRRIAPETEYVWFVDSDDTLIPGALAEQVSYLDMNREVLAVGCGHLIVKPGENSSQARNGTRSRFVPGRIFPRRLSDDEPVTPFVAFVCETGQGPYYLFRSSVLHSINGYDESLWAHEDADLLCRVSLLGEVHFLNSRRLYVKRERAMSMTTTGQEMGSGSVFRAKWSSSNPEFRDLERVRQALKYKSLRHVPFRDLKVAAKLVHRLCLGRTDTSLRTLGLLVWSAVRGFTGINWYWRKC